MLRRGAGWHDRARAICGPVLLVLAAVSLAIGGFGWQEAIRDPVRKTASLAAPDWPVGAKPVRIVLWGDVHLGNANTDECRVARIVRQIMRDRPDLVLLDGDYIAGQDPFQGIEDARRFSAQLAPLRPPLGIVAVLGNHENWSAPGTIAAVLGRAGVAVIENSAVRRGPILIGAVGDTTSGHAHLGATLNALQRLDRVAPGAHIYLSHSPDILHWLPKRSILFAGHTHCGQIVLPILQSLFPVSREFGNRLRCGIAVAEDKTAIVTAGTGTSNVPIRIGAPPDYWLITIGPRAHL